MNRLLLSIITIFIFGAIASFSSQKQTDNIAQLSAVSLYNIDKNSLQNTINAYLEDHPEIKALKIIESLSKEEYISTYYKDGKMAQGKLPQNLDQYNFYKSTSKYDDEKVGEVYAYFENKKSTKLTSEEKQWLNKNQVITIAVVDNYAPYDFRDDNGKLVGFHSDMIKMINQNLGINIVLKAFDSWKNAFNAAASGDVNGILSLSWSKEREEKYFIYSSPYHFSPYHLVVKEKNKNIISLNNLVNKKIAIEENTIFKDVIEEKIPSAKMVSVENTKKAYESVLNGDTLATISPNINDKLFKDSGLKIATEIFHRSSNLYVGVNKKYPMSASILTKGIDSLSLQEMAKLRQKWLTKSDAIIELNEKESNWIKRNPKVKMIRFFDEPPFTLNGTKNTGYIYELLEYLIESAGLKLEYKDGYKSYKEMLDSLDKGEVDILTTYPTSLDLGSESNIVKSKSILKTPFVIIGNSNNGKINTIKDLYGQKVAVVKGYVQDKHLSKFPQIQKVYVNNNDEGFEAIRSGKAQYYVNNKANTDYILNKSFSTDLSILFELPYNSFPPFSISFAMNGKKQTLVSILNKALEQMPYKKIKQIREKWIISSNQKTKKIVFTKKEQEFLKKHPSIILGADQNWQPFDFRDRFGKHSGFDAEFLDLIRKKLGIDIKVELGAWGELQQKVKDKKLAGLVGPAKTDDREKYMVFTKPYFMLSQIILVRNNSKNLNSLDDLNNKTLALKSGSSNAEYFKKNHPNIKQKIYNTYAEIIRAVSLGEVDAGIANVGAASYEMERNFISNIKVGFDVGDLVGDMRFGIRKDWPELVSIMQKGINAITSEETNKLLNRWLKLAVKNNINALKLSDEEKEFIKKHPKIKVHNEKSWAPYNFYEKNRARGLSIDYMTLLANKAGIELEFISGPTWNEFINKIKAKDLDVMLNIAKSKEREKFLNFSAPYAEILESIFIRSGEKKLTKIEDLFGKTFAVPKGFYYEEILKKYPQIKLLRTNNSLETIRAVSSGKADAFVDISAVVSYYTNKYAIDNIVPGGSIGRDQHALPLHMGIRKDWPELVSILNKALYSLSDDEINEIEKKWLFQNNRNNFTQNLLTFEEQKWIKENIVKVGVENWAPVVFSTTGKDIQGIAGDVFKLIIERTGLRVEIVNDLWDPLLKGLKDKKLDILPATYYTDERATYGLYSTGYFNMLDYIYVKDKNNEIKSMKDLNGKKLAIPKGFGTIPKVKEKFPDIEIIETIDLDDSMQKVLSGEVDALFDGQIAIEYKIQENFISGLKGIAQNSFDAASLHLFVNKDKVILHSILQKALNSISKKEISKIKSDWIFISTNSQNDFGIVDEKKELSISDILPLKEILIGLILFLIIFYFIWKYQIKSSGKDFALKGTLFVIIGMFLLMASLITIITMQNIEKSQKNEIKESLKTVLNSSYKTIKIWANAKFRRIEIVLDNKEILELMENLDKKENLDKINKHFKTFEKVFEDSRYYLLSKELNLVSSNSKTLKNDNLSGHISELISKNANFDKTILLPHKDEDGRENDLVFIKSIKGKNDNIVAYLAMEVDPKKEFTRILQNGRIGKSGETYAFNENLELISNSRFDDQLKEMGLLKEDENSYLNIKIETPNKKETLAAKNLLEEKSGVSTDGYIDYRGVKVYGAWIWDDRLKIAFVTEIDEDEAMGAFNQTKKTIYIIVFSIVLFTIFLTILVAWISTQSKKSLQKANEDLNKLLNSFDENVIASKTDTKGKILYASKAFCEISGFSQKELIGSPQNIVRHPDTPSELFKDLWITIQSGKVWRGEVKNKKKNGDFYWVDVIITPEFASDGNVIGYSAIRQDITAKKEVEELSQNLELKVEERTSELKQSQDQFSSMASNVPGVIYRCKVDDNWTMLFISNEIKKLSGYPVSDFINNEVRSFADIMHKDDIEPVATLIQEQIDKGEKFLVDYRVIDKTGVVKWVRSQGQLYENDEAEQWIDGVLFDVTEQRKLEEEIAQNKLFLDTLLDSQEQMVITTDGIQLRSCNKAFLDFFDLEDMDQFLKDYDCICDTFEKDDSSTYLQKHMEEKSWIEYILSHDGVTHKAVIKKDGYDRIFTVTAAILPLGDGNIKSAVFTDITELEEIRKNIEVILSNIMLPVLITSKKDRTILYANEYSSKQYEMSIDELIGSSIDNVYTSAEQKDEILTIMNEQGYVENLEEKYKTQTGKEFIGLLSVKPILYNGEESYIGMVVDITKQKEIEEEIREIHKLTKDSIEYAALIQHALIPEENLFDRYFNDFFAFWEPKDIVGGDIYLFDELRNDNECLLFVIDCTGHGVPGAFVTMLVKAIERQVGAMIASDPSLEVSPAWILEYFNKTMKKLLKQENKDSISNAGFDGGILYYNKEENIIKFAGAETALFYLEDEELKMIKGNRHSIGYKSSNADYEFKEHIVEIKGNMRFYIATDGYIDQNGGEKGFCFSKSRFKNIILENYKKPFKEQKDIFKEKLLEYQGENIRNDDITLVGFEIDKNNESSLHSSKNWVI